MKRLKKILKWTGIVLGGLVAILLVANAVFVSTTDSQLEKQLEAIRASGDPLTLADLAQKPVPPDQNAVTYLRRAEADIKAMNTELDAYWEWVREHEYSRMPPDIQKIVQGVFDAHPNVLPLLKQASECPDFNAQLDLSEAEFKKWYEHLSYWTQQIRGAARILDIDAKLLTSLGNYDEALRVSLSTLRLGYLYEREPAMLNYLVAMTIRGIGVSTANMAMQSGPVSQEARNALETELAKLESTDQERFLWAMKSERAFMDNMFQYQGPRQNWWIVRGYMNRMRLGNVEAWTISLSATSENKSLREELDLLGSITQVEASGKILYPSIRAFYISHACGMAYARTLRVLNAIQSHVPAGSNAGPADSNAVLKLSELGLPVEATTDPFIGEPLHVKKLPQGWLVYSVGRNFEDDGGDVADLIKDIGVGPLPPEKVSTNEDSLKKASP
jgi:hypothetical protein